MRTWSVLCALVLVSALNAMAAISSDAKKPSFPFWVALLKLSPSLLREAKGLVKFSVLLVRDL